MQSRHQIDMPMIGIIASLSMIATFAAYANQGVAAPPTVTTGDVTDRAESATHKSGDNGNELDNHGAGQSPSLQFATDIVPILTRRGCNGGGCHGKANGQNGFELSLLGFEPEHDYAPLAKEANGRRISASAPERSLLLLKATGQIPHRGGTRLNVGDEDYHVLVRWISEGATGPRPDDRRVVRVDLAPTDLTLAPHTSHPLQVTAIFSDGTERDVTRQAVYQSNRSEIVSVSDLGIVTAQDSNGLASLLARFGREMATCHVVVPVVRAENENDLIDQQLARLEHDLTDNRLNAHLVRQWRKLRVLPSPEVDDATFLRRATIDICGTLPTSSEVETYVHDRSPDKRSELIERLLDRPEYANYFALKWGDILQNRGAGYSTARQRHGTALFAAWIRDAIASNMPYDQFVEAILSATGSQALHPPTVWYRTVRRPTEYVESVSQAFLGVRIQCAQCHHHPTAQWSQEDYYGFAAFFNRVGRKGGFADAEVPTNEMIYVARFGETRHPRTGSVLAPRPLGSEPIVVGPLQDPRRQLVAWMTDGQNRFFARALVNRMWAHFMGRGIVEPIDDNRPSNPPSNPELLDALADVFVASRYDMKELIRLITSSYAYRLAATPTDYNASDHQTYSRFYPRRLTAEVLLDAVSQVLAVPTDFGSGVVPGTRAIELPDENVSSHFLDVFGRPARRTACECERVDHPSITQALELVNSPEVQRKLTDETGFIHQISHDTRPLSQKIDELFKRVMGRPARLEEAEMAADFLTAEFQAGEPAVDDPMAREASQHGSWASLAWSLIASNEFLFQH